jgi:maltose O-acetyltransferase
MSLWVKCLNRFERYTVNCRSTWYRRWFALFEQPRHRAVELGSGVVFNVPVRGGKGTLRIGDNSVVGFPEAYHLGSGEIMLQARLSDAEISIGRDTWFNNNTVLCAMKSIRIGDACRIGDSVAIYDADFHELSPATRNRSVGPVEPVTIGNNVWIGSRAMILKGVTIGDNSVIGAMSLVTKNVPPNSLAAGVPAKVIRSLE